MRPSFGTKLLLPILLKLGIITVIPFHLITVEGQDVGTDTVEEPAIMAHTHDHAGEGGDGFFQRA